MVGAEHNDDDKSMVSRNESEDAEGAEAGNGIRRIERRL